MSVQSRYPSLFAGAASVVAAVVAYFGLDVPADALGVIVTVVVASTAWLYRRVAPVIKAQRGFRAVGDFLVTLQDEPLIDEILAELEDEDVYGDLEFGLEDLE